MTPPSGIWGNLGVWMGPGVGFSAAYFIPLMIATGHFHDGSYSDSGLEIQRFLYVMLAVDNEITCSRTFIGL